MLGILKAIFGAPATRRQGPQASLLNLAIEKTVDATDTRLRVVPGYQKKLRAGVERSIDYVRDIVTLFDEPLALTRSAFAADPEVHAFFATAEDINRVVRGSRPLTEYLDQPGNRLQDDVFAGMRMERSEKLTVAPALRGDMVQMDVMRTAVNFARHEIVLPAASIESLREELMERAFMNLVASALARLTSIKVRKTELQKRQILLKRKLKHVQGGQLGLQPLAHGPGTVESIPTLERNLEEVDRELSETAASLGTLEDYLVQINDVMGRPEDHIQVSRASSRVSPMGFKATGNDQDETHEVSYTEIRAGDEAQFVARLVKFSWRDLCLEAPRSTRS